jgi:hypothetical protein
MNSSRSASCVISLGEPGVYRVNAQSSDFFGILVSGDGTSEFAVQEDWTFVASAHFISAPSPSLDQSLEAKRLSPRVDHDRSDRHCDRHALAN